MNFIKKRRLIRVFGLMFACLLSAQLHAGEARDMLNTFLNNTEAMQAKFQQKLLDPHGLLLQQSAGDFMLRRPGKFVWDYHVPYAQKIVSNGSKIWIYDSELEQVSSKNYSEMLSGAPVMLLEQGEDIDAEFRVEDMGQKNGLYWVRLVPRSSDNEFREIRIGLLNGQLRNMTLLDAFEQTTVIEFEHVQINPQLAIEQFEFVPPAGTDVVGEY